MLLDSNIIIYAIKPEFSNLRDLVEKTHPMVSAISYVEVLGYHKLTSEDREDFEEFFDIVPIIHISQTIIEEAAALRQQRKMSLGDSIIAATTIVHNLTLVTANVKDFEWIQDITILNPLENQI
ncbi:MAG: type II toxin-antitoxin system VapC family toxin [Desulfamplus sp.]|nr:type II toxin-antitoxin system VapC family toxin [Desulfamplus sp.]